MFLMFIGGCAGSTTCGIKIFRIQILYSFVVNQLKKIVYPKFEISETYQGQD